LKSGHSKSFHPELRDEDFINLDEVKGEVDLVQAYYEVPINHMLGEPFVELEKFFDCDQAEANAFCDEQRLPRVHKDVYKDAKVLTHDKLEEAISNFRNMKDIPNATHAGETAAFKDGEVTLTLKDLGIDMRAALGIEQQDIQRPLTPAQE
jgi:hypothetical protein